MAELALFTACSMNYRYSNIDERLSTLDSKMWHMSVYHFIINTRTIKVSQQTLLTLTSIIYDNVCKLD